MALTRGPGYAAGTGNAVEIIGAAGKGIAQGFKAGNKQTVKRIQKMTKKRDDKLARNSKGVVEAPAVSTAPVPFSPERKYAVRQELQGHVTAAREAAAQATLNYKRPNSAPTSPATLDEVPAFAVKKAMMSHYRNQVNANLSALQHNNNS